MEFITSWQRQGRAEGILQSRRDTLLELLQEKFGHVPETTVQRIEAIYFSSFLSFKEFNGFLNGAMPVGAISAMDPFVSKEPRLSKEPINLDGITTCPVGKLATKREVSLRLARVIIMPTSTPQFREFGTILCLNRLAQDCFISLEAIWGMEDFCCRYLLIHRRNGKDSRMEAFQLRLAWFHIG